MSLVMRSLESKTKQINGNLLYILERLNGDRTGNYATTVPKTVGCRQQRAKWTVQPIRVP